jgi:hypothetical protein
MLKAIAAATLACTVLATAAPASAERVCRNSHGKAFDCHKVVAPRVNFKAKHPIKVQRCRSNTGGRFNKC